MSFPSIPFLKKTLSVIGLLFFINHSFSQTYTTKKTATGKAKEAFEEGSKFSGEGNYGKALVAYSNALKADSTFVDAIIWMAGCQFELKNLTGAEAAFEKAARLAPDYEPRVWYNLTLVERDAGKFLEAAEHAEKFLTYDKRISVKARSEMRRLAQNCRFAAKALQNPVKFDPKPLPATINTKDDEYLPTITADGERMIFCRRKSDENFFFSQKSDSVWQNAIYMDAINTPGNEGAQCLSADGSQLFFTACSRKEDGMGGCDLYFSENKNGNWTKPKNLGAIINGPRWDSQPSLSADGRQLFFASDRTDGWGGKDILLAKRNADGTWDVPKNIGDPINTLGNEQAPFIHPDGQTLYFMSDHHPGMGTGDQATYDLFVSRKKADGNWTVPENLGFPINTAGNEGAFYVSLDGKTAYFTAQNHPKGMGGDDIFSFELPENLRPQPMTFVKAKVLDFETRQPLVAKTDFVDLADRQTWQSGATKPDGTFLVCLPVGKNFGLEVSKKGYLFHSENFNLTEEKLAAQPFLLEILLQKLPEGVASSEKPAANAPAVGKPIILKNIFFETNSATLKPESEGELNILKKLLDENPTLKIRINGYTDDVGTDSENQILSENRARAVFDFLQKNGIAGSRLAFRGFGESMPIETNSTPEGRAANRRTEFEVVN